MAGLLTKAVHPAPPGGWTPADVAGRCLRRFLTGGGLGLRLLPFVRGGRAAYRIELGVAMDNNGKKIR
jgi:hypothetical protein